MILKQDRAAGRVAEKKKLTVSPHIISELFVVIPRRKQAEL